MRLVKKLILSFSIVLTMAIAFVIGYIGNKDTNNGFVVDNTPTQTSKNDETIYHYNAGEVRFQRGTEVINYNYTPSINSSAETVKPVAYEYCFGNNLNRSTAVNLKSIDTTGVNVTYAYSYNQKLTTTDDITSYETFTLQKLENPDDKVYIYLLVTPTSAVMPTTFTQSIVWYYGIPQQVHITDSTTGQVIETKSIVTGQQIDNKTLPIPQAPASEFVTSSGSQVEIPYYFDAWYKDKDFKYIADEQLDAGQNLYARFANLKSDWISGNSIIPGSSVLPTNIVIPSKFNNSIITTITTNVFNQQRNTMKSISLPNTITTIQNYAFSDLDNLKSINMPASLTTMGTHVFYNSNQIATIDLIECTKLTAIPNYTFNTCFALTSVNLPNTITSIGNKVFESSDLTEIVMPNSVTTLGNNIFQNCASLKNATIPNMVKDIGTNVFYNCTSLVSATIPEHLTSIPDGLFQGCTSLAKVNIPEHITSIGQNTFANCKLLNDEDIDLSKLIKLESIGYRAFRFAGLKNVTLPASVTTIGERAFEQITTLNSIDLSKCVNLTTISQYVFYGCTGLSDILLPSSVTTIGNNAFWKCTSLKTVVIPEAVSSIGNNAFKESGLTTINIPANVSMINSGAFSGCPLEMAYFGKTSEWYAGSTKISVTDPAVAASNLVEFSNVAWTYGLIIIG